MTSSARFSHFLATTWKPLFAVANNLRIRFIKIITFDYLNIKSEKQDEYLKLVLDDSVLIHWN